MTINTTPLSTTGVTFTQAGVEFTGNNVPGVLAWVDSNGVTQSVSGVASRPIKSGSTVHGFYIWIDNAPVGVTGREDKAYILSIDNSYFNARTEINSSSDQVDAALNKYVAGANKPPVNTVPAAQTVGANSSLAFTGSSLVSVTDPDSNLATVKVTVTSGVLAVTLPAGVSIVAGANDSSTLTLSGTGSALNAALATLVYRSNPGFTGTDTLTVTSTDSGTPVLNDVDSVSIQVTNAAPTATPIADQNGTDSTAFNLNIAGNFSDPNGDTLTYSATGLPPGLALDPATGLITGTLGSSASAGGPYTVTVTATDPSGAKISVTFKLGVANPAPVAVNDTLTVAYQTAGSGTVAPNDSDVDGDTLTFAKATDPANGTVTMSPDGSYTTRPRLGSPERTASPTR